MIRPLRDEEWRQETVRPLEETPWGFHGRTMSHSHHHRGPYRANKEQSQNNFPKYLNQAMRSRLLCGRRRSTLGMLTFRRKCVPRTTAAFSASSRLGTKAWSSARGPG